MKKVKIKKVLSEYGNRVYVLNGEVQSGEWALVDLSGFPEQKAFFLNVSEDGTVQALVHKCPQLPDKAFYVWQPRLYKPPMKPFACPRCRYRLDYQPQRSRS